MSVAGGKGQLKLRVIAITQRVIAQLKRELLHVPLLGGLPRGTYKEQGAGLDKPFWV